MIIEKWVKFDNEKLAAVGVSIVPHLHAFT